MLIKILVFIILGFFTIYIGIGALPYYMSDVRGDYPGPKELYSNYSLTRNGVDYLLIHGGSLDARVWSGVLARNSAKSMVAISLSQHEDGVKYANSRHAASEILQYLSLHKVNRAIIAHSTGALWVAEAYARCPDCFKNLQVVLLAPNFGDNILTSDLQTLKQLKRLSWLLPDPMLNFNKIDACEGGGSQLYDYCKKIYYYKRLFTFISIKYYSDLVDYAQSIKMRDNLVQFLEKDRSNITIYISDSDKVLDPNITVNIVKKYHILYHVVPNLSHVMLADDDKIWLH